MNRPEFMPNYRRHEGLPSKRLPSSMIEYDGKQFIVAFAEGLTTGLTGTTANDLRPVITIWQDPVPERGRPIGIGLSFTPDDEHLDMIIESLTGIRDRCRAQAKEQANAMLRKAAGK